MSSKKESRGIDEISKSISILESQLSLTSDELHKYYIEREPKAINMIKNLFMYTENQPIKILFSGHIGCGKSSELFKLKKELED